MTIGSLFSGIGGRKEGASVKQGRLFHDPPRPPPLSLEQRQRNAAAARRIVEILEAQERPRTTTEKEMNAT